MSYQNSQGYQPSATQTFAEHQTSVLHDTVKTQYQTEETAQAVLSQLHTQRHQLGAAADDVWEMRIATEQAKRELQALKDKHMSKKRRLYTIIGVLGAIDFILFLRLIQCHGSFICW
jgi:ribosomal protein L3